MNEEQIREIAKETFAENIMNNLDSSIVFKYIQELEQENQKYKEVIEKAKEWVERKINSCTIEANSTTTDTMCRITIVGLTNLLDILKEVEHE